MTLLSVIIPTLNEADNLAGTLACLEGELVHEVIVVDGGSEDATRSIAEEAGARLLVAERGRARQLNVGAREASGEVLLFLHGDTHIASATLQNCLSAMEEDTGLVGGGFARRFDSSSRLLRFTSWCSDFRGRWWGLFLGDQGIFVRRSVFEKLGGFDEEVSPGEDLDFSYRLNRCGKTRLIGPPVRSSARRFENRGPWKQTRLDFSVAREILASSRRRVEL